MKLSIEEKNILYAFGCSNHENTVQRLKWITILTVDIKVKRKIQCLVKKLEKESVGEYYVCFYQQLCIEMKKYLEAKKCIHMVENSTNWAEVYGKVV